MDPIRLIEQLQSDPINVKLKGTGKIEDTVHLGCRFARNQFGVLYMDPGKYVSKTEDTYVHRFGEKPKQSVQSPLKSGDHPELDVSEFLDEDGIEIYQSLIGSMQWAVSIGRYDIHTAVMTMSGYRVQPRTGHLDRVKRMYGYLCTFCHYKIRFHTDQIDYSMIPHQEYDWDNTPYGEKGELMPADAPPPLGKRVVLTH